jgi:hypothetical protein
MIVSILSNVLSVVLTVFSIGVVCVVGIGSVFLLFAAHRRDGSAQ